MADTETKVLTPEEQRAALEKQIRDAQLALEKLAEPDPATMTEKQLTVAFMDHLVLRLGSPPDLEKYWTHLRPKLAPPPDSPAVPAPPHAPGHQPAPPAPEHPTHH